MNKIFSIIFIFSFIHLFAFQNDSIPNFLNTKNELRLDITKLLFNVRLGITYERNLNNRISVGLNTVVLKGRFYDLDNDWNNYENDLQINPFARLLIHRRPKSEFFAEVLVSYTIGKNRELIRVVENPNAFYEYQDNKVEGWGSGMAIGGKFVVFENFNLELSLGGGRAKIRENTATFINRSSLSISYRF